jgi:hypothetical protein
MFYSFDGMAGYRGRFELVFGGRLGCKQGHCRVFLWRSLLGCHARHVIFYESEGLRMHAFHVSAEVWPSWSPVSMGAICA